MDIISVTPVMCNYFGICLILAGFLFCVIWLISLLFTDDADFFVVAAIICIFIGVITNNFFCVDYTGYNKYVVRINDSVTFNEVIKDYDIIEIDEENNLITLQNKVENENKP